MPFTLPPCKSEITRQLTDHRSSGLSKLVWCVLIDAREFYRSERSRRYARANNVRANIKTLTQILTDIHGGRYPFAELSFRYRAKKLLCWRETTDIFLREGPQKVTILHAQTREIARKLEKRKPHLLLQSETLINGQSEYTQSGYVLNFAPEPRRSMKTRAEQGKGVSRRKWQRM